ncbi:hypothetical protein H6P81_010523 [Aristolochia fimbriata]|uniref:Uncharacterized protein n=1 Tax=Aristolochia fimbriata TaxID=158543 RepID=A0AAV7ETG1_ARIFI|nr:hypothetical protein H6P81_010523 [Aristolochia fimbriata]
MASPGSVKCKQRCVSRDCVPKTAQASARRLMPKRSRRGSQPAGREKRCHLASSHSGQGRDTMCCAVRIWRGLQTQFNLPSLINFYEMQSRPSCTGHFLDQMSSRIEKKYEFGWVSRCFSLLFFFFLFPFDATSERTKAIN